VWPKDSREALAMRERLRHDRIANLPPSPAGKVRLTGLAGLADFAAKADPELVANAMVCAINQAVYLLKRQIESQGRRFLKEGGFTENMYRQRQKARCRGGRSERSDQSD
jgi:four helix bundle suffix protein